jgi:hypothetical protein
MMSFFKRSVWLFMLMSEVAFSHGYLGERFFPSAIIEQEPFINDKVALPIFYSESPGAHGGEVWTTNPQLQYAKTITKNFQLSATGSYSHIHYPEGQAQNGFNNWQAGMRYNLFLYPHAQSMLSAGLNASIGGTGSHRVNAPSTTTLSPALLFAQGFGILPDSISWLRPLGLAVSLSPNLVTTNYAMNSVSWGGAIEYSLPYFNQFVGHVDSVVMDHLVPIIEFPFTTCTSNTCQGRTTGTIDPGIIVYNNYGQIGLEALIPSNHATGSKVGGVLQFYLYLENVFPNSLGKPIF